MIALIKSLEKNAEEDKKELFAKLADLQKTIEEQQEEISEFKDELRQIRATNEKLQRENKSLADRVEKLERGSTEYPKKEEQPKRA